MSHNLTGKLSEWTSEEMEKALEACQSGLSIAKVSRKYGIPNSTLHNHYRKLCCKLQKSLEKSSSELGAVQRTVKREIESAPEDAPVSKVIKLDSGFYNFETIRNTIKVSNEDQISVCKFCGIRLKSLFLLSLHLMQDHLSMMESGDGEFINCPHCDKPFENDIMYRKHHSSRHSKGRVKYCTFCPFNGPAAELKTHIEEDHISILCDDDPVRTEEDEQISNLPSDNDDQLEHKPEDKADCNETKLIERTVIQFSHPKYHKLSCIARALKNFDVLASSEPEEFEDFDSMMKCAYCPRPLYSSSDYMLHLATQHLQCPKQENGYISCPHCLQQLSSEKAFRRHMSSAHGNTSLEYCLMCKFSTLRPYLSEHITDHLPQPADDFSPSIMNECDCHIKILKREKNLTSIKGVLFEEISDVKVYDWNTVYKAVKKLSNTEKEEFVSCPFCSSVFNSFGMQLMIHVSSCHVKTSINNANKIQCPHCPEFFGNGEEIAYRKHLNDHIRSTNLAFCRECKMTSNRTYTRNVHVLKQHCKELYKLVPASVKTFLPANELRARIAHAVNSCESQVLRKCPLCPYMCTATRGVQGLRRHLLHNHLAVKRASNGLVPCHHCGKHFSDDIELRRHFIGEQKIQRAVFCAHCPYEGGTNDNVYTHLLNEHMTELQPEILLGSWVRLGSKHKKKGPFIMVKPT